MRARPVDPRYNGRMDFRAGTYVTPEVRLVSQLGQGGMGSVWRARHERLESDVAVKLMSDVAVEDPAAMERFRREAALSGKIDNPHAVQTFDHGVMQDGRPYIVMEYLRGEPLGERLARDGMLRPPEVGVVVTQVAQVLDQAHRLGVVHRDIKPDNVFLLDVDAGLFAKVLDFGIAKRFPALDVSRVTDTGAIVGTPEYMSPEQLLSTNAADARADRWALAVLAYHCLTGRLPFHGETLPALSIAICKGECPPPSSHGLPASLDPWFSRAFAPEPSERFDSVLAMAEQLVAVVGGVDALVATGTQDEDEPPPESGRRLSGAPPEDIAEELALLDEASAAETDNDNAVLAPNAVLSASEREAERELYPLADAPPERDSGVRPFYPDADADQSGRRRALAEHMARDVVSPTFAGSASKVPPPEAPSRVLSVMVGLLAVVGIAMVIAGYVMRNRAIPGSHPADHVAAPVEPVAPATALPTNTPTALPSNTPTAVPTDAHANAPNEGAGGKADAPP
jgi:eukaryotic-like serine/threonine-protein kinase